jgi:hypothetical protein
MSSPAEVAGGAATFAAGTLNVLPDSHQSPQISQDGRTLSLEVVQLDYVYKEMVTKRGHSAWDHYEAGINLYDLYAPGTIVPLLGFLLNPIESTSNDTRNPFNAVASSLATCLHSESNALGSIENTTRVDHELQGSIDRTPEHLPRLWLCELLDREVGHWTSNIRYSMTLPRTMERKDALATELATLRSLYLKLIATYDDLPWSGTAHEGLSEPLQESDRAQRLKEERLKEEPWLERAAKKLGLGLSADEYEMREGEDAMFLTARERKQPVSLGAMNYQYALHREGGLRKMFVTKNGSIGIGPSWLQTRDRVMLVQHAAIPFLFRHISDVNLDEIIQKTKASLIVAESKLANSQLQDTRAAQKQHVELKESSRTQRLKFEACELRAKLEKHEFQLGKDAWFLVGEAYVEGIMHGEAIELVGSNAFERIAVV